MELGKHLRRGILAVLIACAAPASAFAYSECSGKVQRIWIGDSGSVWIFLQSGPAAALSANDPNREGALAAAMSAQATGRNVTLRFSADSVSCSVQVARFDFVGMYLE
ncbi:hypothetical protein [Caulobacter sp. Root1472]|uniref:hypothetical protein n=1 Tax=Caulobacter sp. Root1472 TaxID=1736470 RepID=UPI0006FC0B4F|nr:hypothetical protein [Caulobacter sp. Root1472]KQZ22899.1 hypothetical protein ASD47_24285 [Caulobacter sp. Root1472]